MFSIVIRNKNEAAALDHVLRILTTVYADDYHEIIIVDNHSTDNSVAIAQKYGCRIITIDQFTYGRAINYGIAAAESSYILLLSSHAVPIGASFFKNTLHALRQHPKAAGVRFINSIENYNRAVQYQFKVQDALGAGLMAACCIVNKDVWQQYRFDETLMANEDKHWSKRVIDNGFEVLDLNETYFYFIKRTAKGLRKRYKVETIESLRMRNQKADPPLRIILLFFKKILITNPIQYLKTLGNDFAMLRVKFEIYRKQKAK